MTAITPEGRAARGMSPLLRLVLAIPVLGWVLRDILRDAGDVWYLLVAVVSLLVIGVATWGLPVLAMTALAAVPAMFVILILITRG
jgi:hypothetical protein